MYFLAFWRGSGGGFGGVVFRGGWDGEMGSENPLTRPNSMVKY